MKKVNGENNVRWYNEKNKLHRIILPALIHDNGTKWWYRNGLAHRLDGSAGVYWDGKMTWYWLGQYVTEQQHALLSNVRFFTKRVKI